MSNECLNGSEMSKVEDKVTEFFNTAEAVQVEEGTWYYHEASVESELKSVYEQLAKANEDYKTLFSAFESCQDELKESNERVKALDEIVDTAFIYKDSSAEYLRAWTKLRQLRKEKDK